MITLAERKERAKFRVAAAQDSADPILLVLKALGYEFGFEMAQPVPVPVWWAEKDDSLFTADDPWTLLGIVMVWECKGSEWQNANGDPYLWTN